MTDKIAAKRCRKPERYCLGLNETHVSCDTETKYGNKTYTCSCSQTS